jgi:hypothetical protein
LGTVKHGRSRKHKVSCSIAYPSSSLLYQEYSESLLFICLNSIKDPDLNKANVIRMMGHLLAKMNQYSDMTIQAFTLLIEQVNIGTFKNRWNICHALSQGFKNDHFQPSEVHQKTHVTELMKSIEHCRNYKVKIHAAQALAALYPKVSPQWKEAIRTVIDRVSHTMTNLQNADFGEYRYIEQLDTAVSSF